MRIFVDQNVITGEFNINMETGGMQMEHIDSCFTEESVHATLITLIDEKLGKFLSYDDYIIHTETFGHGWYKTKEKISVIEYLEEN